MHDQLLNLKGTLDELCREVISLLTDLRTHGLITEDEYQKHIYKKLDFL